MKNLSLLLITLALILLIYDSVNKKIFRGDVKFYSRVDSFKIKNFEELTNPEFIPLPFNVTPIYGYRFQISGDFNGDGVQESFTEHYFSLRDKRETNKYYSGIDDVRILYDSIFERDCISFFKCSNPVLDTIPVGGIVGPIFLKNEGDLDGDGGDEVSFVGSTFSPSSVTHCYIVSFKRGKWENIFSFWIRSWQCPPLPYCGKTYGLFGADGTYTFAKNDSINLLLEKQRKEFPGFITKLKAGKIRVKTFPYAEPIIIIADLRKPNKQE